MSDRAILAISWAMPPLLVPRALQVSRLLEALSSLGWRATVLCVDPGSIKHEITGRDPALEQFYMQRLSWIRIPSPEESKLCRLIFRLLPPLREFPDAKRLWAEKAFQCGKRLVLEKKFEAIVTFAQPWSSHLVGLWLHRHTGIPWLAHFSDPWTDSPYFKKSVWSYWWTRKKEEAVIREASHLVFVDSETADLYRARIPSEQKDRISVVPHAYDPGLFTYLTVSANRSSQLVIVHAGNFYDIRTPLPVFEALARWHKRVPLGQKVQVKFIGPISAAFRKRAEELGLSEIIHFMGPTPYFEALRAMKEADVLLMIEASSEKPNLFLPSKLMDYLGCRKMIFGLTPARGPAATILRQMHCPVVEPDDVEGIVKGLMDLLARKQAGDLAIPEHAQGVIDSFEIRHVAQSFADLLKRVVKA